jgi:hypothetical protein
MDLLVEMLEQHLLQMLLRVGEHHQKVDLLVLDEVQDLLFSGPSTRPT